MWTFPQQNYCTLLTDCTLYSAPFIPDRSSVTLAIVTNRKQISDWPPVLLRQLISSMSRELQQATRSHIRQKTGPTHLTARQRTILLRIAGGMTDRQIAAASWTPKTPCGPWSKHCSWACSRWKNSRLRRIWTAETGRILYRTDKTTDIRELKKLCGFYIIRTGFEPKIFRISPGSSRVR